MPSNTTPASSMKNPVWIAVWLFVLCLLYPIPHTIALRNVVFVSGGIGLLLAWRPMLVNTQSLRDYLSWAKPAARLLALLTVWITFQSAVISPFPGLALANIPGGWLIPVFTAMLGILASMRLASGQAVTAIVLALGTHITFFLLYQFGLFLRDGNWSIGQTPFAERDFHSLLNNLLLALLLADRLGYFLKKGVARLLPSAIAWCLLLVSLAADVLLKTRNGTVVTLLLLVAAFAIILRQQSKRSLLMLSVAGLLTLVIAAGSISVDKRWNGLGESIDAGLHSNSVYWLNPQSPPPVLASGNPIEESAYLRAAFAHQAIEAIERHPLGLGYGHNAFGWAIEMQFGPSSLISSHSGLLDFTLANGFPGLALWLLLSGWFIRAGWRRFFSGADSLGLLMTLSVCAYLMRCLLDAHLSGWRLTLFGLLIGVLIGASASRKTCA